MLQLMQARVLLVYGKKVYAVAQVFGRATRYYSVLLIASGRPCLGLGAMVRPVEP